MNATYSDLNVTLNDEHTRNTSLEGSLGNELNATTRAEDFIASSTDSVILRDEVLLLITIVYGFMVITGVLGNILVCVVIAKQPEMQTATNYYLFSLAIADVTTLLLGAFNELHQYWYAYQWKFGVTACKLSLFIPEATSNASVLTILAFSMERYLAICHPLVAYTMSGLKRALHIIIAVWLIGFVFALPYGFAARTGNLFEGQPDYDNFYKEIVLCGFYNTNFLLEMLPYDELISVIFFFIPMAILIVLYTRIGLTIKRRVNVGETPTAQASKKAVIIMLIAVVTWFFICWAPLHLIRLFDEYMYKFGLYDNQELLNIIIKCSFLFNATINPILYNIMSAKYRKAFKNTFCGSSSSVGNNSGTQTNLEA
ncbi:neuropeptides capa receptor-like [Neocloeon triangulifer]|uniref:neuropeptides capa receptor-like n=1 Tax=Neocloeon triangulifer TaxID=2078957 RepID=UPI00286EE29D|nr:neuropeptides capa receptor-like [Neocloeon triangulifer]